MCSDAGEAAALPKLRHCCGAALLRAAHRTAQHSVRGKPLRYVQADRHLSIHTVTSLPALLRTPSAAQDRHLVASCQPMYDMSMQRGASTACILCRWAAT